VSSLVQTGRRWRVWADSARARAASAAITTRALRELRIMNFELRIVVSLRDDDGVGVGAADAAITTRALRELRITNFELRIVVSLRDDDGLGHSSFNS